jgi:hypothetical protein
VAEVQAHLAQCLELARRQDLRSLNRLVDAQSRRVPTVDLWLRIEAGWRRGGQRRVRQPGRQVRSARHATPARSALVLRHQPLMGRATWGARLRSRLVHRASRKSIHPSATLHRRKGNRTMNTPDHQNNAQAVLGQKYAFATAALLLGIASFLSLLGLEKGILAVIFGLLALRAQPLPLLAARRAWAKTGVVLGAIHVALVLVIVWSAGASWWG